MYMTDDILELFKDLSYIKENWSSASIMRVEATFPSKGIPSCNVSFPVGTCVFDPNGRQVGVQHKTTMRSNLGYDFLPCVIVKHYCGKRELTNDLNAMTRAEVKEEKKDKNKGSRIIFRGVLQSESVNIAVQQLWQNTITIHHWTALLAASQLSSVFMNSISSGAPSQYGLGVMYAGNSAAGSKDDTATGSMASPSLDTYSMKSWMSGKADEQMNANSVVRLGKKDGVDAMIIQLLRNLAYDKTQNWEALFKSGNGRTASELQKRADTAQKVVQMIVDHINDGRKLPTHVKALGQYVTKLHGSDVLQRMLDMFMSHIQSNRFSLNYWDLLNYCAKTADLQIVCTVNELTLEPCSPMQTNPLSTEAKRFISNVLSASQTQAHSRPIVGAQLVTPKGTRVTGTVNTKPDTAANVPGTRQDYMKIMGNVSIGRMYCPPLETAAQYNSFGSIAYFVAPSWVTLNISQQFSFVNPKHKNKTVQQIISERPAYYLMGEEAEQRLIRQETSLKLATDLTQRYYWMAIHRLRTLTITVPLTLNFCPHQQVLVVLDVILTGVISSVTHSIDAANQSMITKISLVHVSKATKKAEDYNVLVKHPIYDNEDAFSGRNLVKDTEAY
jgi:hypothetical protein